MALDKRLKILVEKMVSQSFDKDDRLDQRKSENFLQALKELPRIKMASALSLYLKGIKRETKKSVLVIESAVELSKQQVLQIEKTMSKDFKINAREVYLTPSLLGGLRVKISDLVFDDTVNRKIQKMKEIAYA